MDKKERWSDDTFDGDSFIMRWVSGITVILISGLIGFIFSQNADQNHAIDTLQKNIDVNKTEFRAHVEATGKIEEMTSGNIDERFDKIENNIEGMKKGIDTMSKNQLLIMRALKIKPVD